MLDVLTIGEFAPGSEASETAGVGMLRDATAEIIATWNRRIDAALADAAIRSRPDELRNEPFVQTPNKHGASCGRIRQMGRGDQAVGRKAEVRSDLVDCKGPRAEIKLPS